MNPSLTQLTLAAAMLTLALLGYGWGYNLVAGESATAAGLSQSIATKTETAQRANALEAALAQLESSQSTVEGYFISESNIVSFLGELQTLGTDIGSKVSVVSVGAPSSKSSQTLSVSLTIDGSFDAVMRTIGAIENAPYAISVVSAVVSSRSDVTSTSWSAALTIAVGSVATQPATQPVAQTK